MKLARLLGVALVAIFVVSAMVAAEASAADPEFTVLPTVKTFVSLSGLSILDSANGNSIDCTSDVNSGEITSMDTVGDVHVHFLGCSVYAGTEHCTIKSTNTTGEGLILTNTLNGLLGLVDKDSEATSLVGILFEPVSGKVFVTLAETAAACGTPITAVEGTVAGEVLPINEESETGHVFIQAEGSKQRIKSILVLGGSVKPKLSSFGADESSESTLDIIHWGGKVEID